MKYIFDVDDKNFIVDYRASEDGTEVADEDLMYLPCCQFIDGKVILNEERKGRYVSHLRKEMLAKEKAELEAWLSAHDYIGVKIATSRATIEEYADEIALMAEKAERINEIDRELNSIN